MATHPEILHDESTRGTPWPLQINPKTKKAWYLKQNFEFSILIDKVNFIGKQISINSSEQIPFKRNPAMTTIIQGNFLVITFSVALRFELRLVNQVIGSIPGGNNSSCHPHLK